MAELQELIERLEKLDGPDREADFSIARMEGWTEHTDKDDPVFVGKVSTWWAEPGDEWSFSSPPVYTASLDAAVGLVERLNPDWTWNIGGCPPDFLTDKDKPFGAELMGPVSWEVIDREVGYPEPVYATASASHATPAIALLIALFRSLPRPGDANG